MTERNQRLFLLPKGEVQDEGKDGVQPNRAKLFFKILKPVLK